MPLFPDMPVPGSERAIARLNGHLSPGDTSGVLPGLEEAIRAVLRNYNPGDVGICEISDKIQLALPVPDWSSYCWTEERDDVWAATASANQAIYTVPSNERNHLVSWASHRSAGDNTFSILLVTSPAGYGSGSRIFNLMETGAGFTRLYWPNEGDGQDIASNALVANTHGPLLLEPGSILSIFPDGAGVAATTITSQILLIRTKLVRALDP